MTTAPTQSQSGSPSGPLRTSRLIVKNLPKYCTAEMLRKHFSAHPSAAASITDLKLAHTADGKFRRFAFIGLRSERDAEAVRRHFDGTYFDTSKMQVECALPVGDANLPRAWSRYTAAKQEARSSGSVDSAEAASAAAAASKAARDAAELEKKRRFLFSIYGDSEAAATDLDAAELDRFLKAMRPKSQTKTWENDDDAAATPAELIDPKASAKLKLAQKQKQAKRAKVAVAVESVPVRKAGGVGLTVPKVHMKFADDNDEQEAEFEFEKSDDEDLYEDFRPARRDLKDNDDEEVECAEETITDAGSLQETAKESTTISTNTNTDNKDSSNNESSINDSSSSINTDKSKFVDPALIAETGRLFVRNLSYACTETDLEALFSPFGPLSSVHLPIASDTKKVKGFAYVLFTVPDDAVRAYTALDGTIFQGRLLHILPAHEQKDRNVDESSGGDSNSSFKSKKQAELMASAASAHNWNSLFIRPDTVLDAVAARLGVPKSSIMDPNSSSSSSAAGDLPLATRLAVAETHIIQETKDYLESQGVRLDSFASGKAAQRSNLVILVKNLPFSVDADALRKLFARFGALRRFILPPTTRSIAMVEFLEANEAKAAFRALAYTKFESAPLFLEWAPLGCLAEPVAEQVVQVEQVQVAEQAEQVQEQKHEHEHEQVQVQKTTAAALTTDTIELTHTYTLFVKNLNFSTTEDALNRLFSTVAPVRSVRIPKKPGNLSMGFGFVEFTAQDDLTRALDRLQGATLDGHVLQLKVQASGQNNAAAAAAKPSSRKRNQLALSDETLEALRPTKLLLKNIPFEASERELRSLITSFTPALKRLRLPKKFDGGLRGFGFAEFGSHAEAKHLMEQLGATHFYGRHLVIEWAKPDETTQN